jgi:hypothetical protein
MALSTNAADENQNQKLEKKGAVKAFKKKKLYAKRFVQANLFLFPLLIVSPIAYQLTLPERAPLPFNATDAFNDQFNELSKLTNTKINLKYLVEEEQQHEDEQLSTCMSNFLKKKYHLQNHINKHMETVKLTSKHVGFFHDNYKNYNAIETYLSGENLIYKDHDPAPGVFTFLIVVLNNLAATTSLQENENNIILGQARYGWTFVTKQQICSLGYQGKTSAPMKYENVVIDKLYDHLTNPGQHLPNGIEIMYPSYHLTLSLLLENPDEKIRVDWNEYEKNGSIDGFLHESSRMKRLGTFLKILNENVVRLSICPFHPTRSSNILN